MTRYRLTLVGWPFTVFSSYSSVKSRLTIIRAITVSELKGFHEESDMGLGPPIIELYRQLKLQGALEDGLNVMELGSQDYWCPQKNQVRGLFSAFGRDPDQTLLDTDFSNQKPARLLYEGLGMKYSCVDVDGRTGTLVLDFNFDQLPDEHKGKYGLVTNHGTSEHILDQRNVFKSMHELARVGGLLIHAVPFTVHLEHGFFNYQPNFFEALARYNSYETLGVWVGPGWQLASLIPWDPNLLDYLSFSSKTTHLLVVVHRKRYDKEFCVPFQGLYEGSSPGETRSRYSMVIDGEILDLNRVKYLSMQGRMDADLSKIPGRTLATELRRRLRRRIKRRLGFFRGDRD
jgi:hypothetical protein